MLTGRGLQIGAVLALSAGLAHAQISDGVVKIGVLNDQSGTYADLAGPGSVVAARMAVEDFGAAKKGMKVEIVVADHQNKPDVGSSIARQWFDADKVDMIVDVPTSSVALAVNQIAKDKNKVLIPEMTIDDCRRLIADGTITDGMIPKIETCIYALEKGVEAVVILDGKVPHAALIELFTDTGAGTIIRR